MARDFTFRSRPLHEMVTLPHYGRLALVGCAPRRGVVTSLLEHKVISLTAGLGSLLSPAHQGSVGRPVSSAAKKHS